MSVKETLWCERCGVKKHFQAPSVFKYEFEKLAAAISLDWFGIFTRDTHIALTFCSVECHTNFQSVNGTYEKEQKRDQSFSR